MAKKKKKKEEKLKFKYTNELYGICFILFAILGIGLGSPLGMVGKLVKAFSVFLFGTWNIVFMIGLFLIGLYMVIAREKPKFFSSRLVGIYIILIGILVYSHLNYVTFNEGDISEIFRSSIDDIMISVNAIMEDVEFTASGGGILGCAFSCLFNKLFDISGTKIVSIVLIVSGIGLFTGVSIFDFIRDGYRKGKELLPKRRDNEDEEEVSKSVIINNGEEEHDKS